MKPKALKWTNRLGDARWQPWLGSRLLYRYVNNERVWYVPPITTKGPDRLGPVLYRSRRRAVRVAKREDRRIQKQLAHQRKLRLFKFEPDCTCPGNHCKHRCAPDGAGGCRA